MYILSIIALVLVVVMIVLVILQEIPQETSVDKTDRYWPLDPVVVFENNIIKAEKVGDMLSVHPHRVTCKLDGKIYPIPDYYMTDEMLDSISSSLFKAYLQKNMKEDQLQEDWWESSY